MKGKEWGKREDRDKKRKGEEGEIRGGRKEGRERREKGGKGEEKERRGGREGRKDERES